MMEIKKYLKRPFEVQAVQVSADNIYEVAKWCQGDLDSIRNEKYIKVRVLHAANERQTQAYIGDWVLYAGTSYRVYTDKAFGKGFLPVEEPEEQKQLTPTYTEAEDTVSTSVGGADFLNS